MQIKFNQDTWELMRIPGIWVIEKKGTKILFKNNLSIKEFQDFLRKKDKGVK